jgi:hypothetical protein
MIDPHTQAIKNLVILFQQSNWTVIEKKKRDIISSFIFLQQST